MVGERVAAPGTNAFEGAPMPEYSTTRPANERLRSIADQIRIPGAPRILRLVSLTSIAVASLAGGSATTLAELIWLAVFAILIAIRTPMNREETPIEIGIEFILATAAILTTGCWSSSFVPLLVVPTMLAAIRLGLWQGISMAVGASAIVAGWSATGPKPVSTVVANTATWCGILCLVAVIADVLRSSLEASAQSAAAARRRPLESANGLLASLHQLAQHMPSSLDLSEVIDSTVGRLRSMFPADVAAILLIEGSPTHLTVAGSSGISIDGQLAWDRLPPELRTALERGTTVRADALTNGLGPRSASAMYVPLFARGALLGALVVESVARNAYTPAHGALAASMVDTTALEIDNARWFARLRTVGADEERNRIARDLHDRIGQALAYLGFELDRLNRDGLDHDDLRIGVDRLRTDVRSVVQEVRDTLYDLRTEVTEQEHLPVILDRFCTRVQERSGLEVTLDIASDLTLPVRQERELWRIAQEAITNVERHAHANRIWVSWGRSQNVASLQITDDGRGFIPGRSGRSDSYGLIGMRERAAAIGASLAITEGPGRGTTVRCTIATTARGGRRTNPSTGGIRT